MVNWSYLCLFRYEGAVTSRLIKPRLSNIFWAMKFWVWPLTWYVLFCCLLHFKKLFCLVCRLFWLWYQLVSNRNRFIQHLAVPVEYFNQPQHKKNSDFVFWNSEHHRQNLPTWFSKKSQRNSGISSLPETNKQDANDTNLKEPPRL